MTWRLVGRAGCACLAFLVGGCKGADDLVVLSLAFEGNRAISDAELASRIATKGPGPWPWSRPAAFERAEFEADLARLRAYYAERGYREARVAASDVRYTPKGDGVRIVVTVTEGEATVIERISYSGLEPLPVDDRRRLISSAPGAGEVFDRQRLAAFCDRAQQRLHDLGYPYATVTSTETVASQSSRAAVAVTATTGPLAHFGDVSIIGGSQAAAGVVRRALTFDAGDVYREREIHRSEQRLAMLPLFSSVTFLPQVGANQSPQVPLVVVVVEQPHRRTTFGFGAGSEEKVSITAARHYVNVFGAANTAVIGAKYSALDRGVAFSLGHPGFFWQTTLSVTGSAWWMHEFAFTSRRAGGRFTIRRASGLGPDGQGPKGQSLAVSFVRESLTYRAAPDRRDESDPALALLGLAPATGRGSGSLASIELDAFTRRVDDLSDPHRGYDLSAHAGQAMRTLGGTFSFGELSGDARAYVSLRHRYVWTVRARAGALFAGSSSAVPFPFRYFLGGSLGLRAWPRDRVSPFDPAGHPIGGRRMIVLTNELARRLNDHLDAIAFVEAGNVWEPSESGAWRYDAGPGLRYRTPLGSIRLDAGFQFNPDRGTTVAPTNRWRVSFSFGQAF